MKFLLDEHVSPKVAEILRGKEIDAINVPIDLIGATDYEILSWAASQNRCVITANIADFSALSELFFKENRKHTGVLCVQGSIPARRFELLAETIVEYVESHPNDVYEYLFDFISQDYTHGPNP